MSNAIQICKDTRKKKVTRSKKYAKLRNNPIFGKSIENPMNNVDVKLETTRKQYVKWSWRPTLKE